MERSTFIKIADKCLNRVADWLEGFDPDEVDFNVGDGVITIEFPDGVKYVLNRQTAADQMWFAAGARAWHYDHDTTQGPMSDAWRNDRDGHDLYECLSGTISEKLGRAVKIGG